MARSVIAVIAVGLAAMSMACGQAAAPSGGAAGGPAQKLVIAVQPTNTPEQLATDAKGLEQFLEAKVGTDVEIIFPTTFAGVIEAIRFGHAQAAFMSAWPAALAQKHAGAEVVLAEIREVLVDGKKIEAPEYYSYWVVRKDSPYANLADLKGKKAALPSQLSTSGYVAPVARMIELGLLPNDGKEADAKRFFSDVLYAGGYAQGWEALKNGQVDVTVIAGDVSESLYREVLSNTKVMEQQGPIPSHSVVFGKNLQEPQREKLKAALLELNAPDKQPLMRKFISGIFVRFKPTTGEQHLASLNKYLNLTQFQFVERLR
ncbi:MAG: phosphate/phosphite/phosphonate ABC transporter substrate-binding protein [Dehalococcoidia bacterium]|nr:phosphate/phosphite/phosphonate ABC transporter substrate-binding protein [Dehalococcoidia bacterium]